MKTALLALALFGACLGVSATLRPPPATAAPSFQCPYCSGTRCARGTVGGTSCGNFLGICFEIGTCEQQ